MSTDMPQTNAEAQGSRQRSLEQERAKEAWAAVAQIKEAGRGFAKEYRSLAMSAPADIQANGLGQTLAFWQAKGKGGTNEHTAIYKHVSTWVSRKVSTGGSADLLEWVVNTATTDGYRRATAESMAYLGWVKRFAEAELPSRDGGSDE